MESFYKGSIPLHPSMNTSSIGNIGQAKVLTKFSELGVPVFLPFGEGYTVDLVAEFNGKLNKIQIKTTQSLHDNSYMKFRITKQDGYHGQQKDYEDNEVDYFAFYCVETDMVLLVPKQDTKSEEFRIRLDDYEGKRTSTMHFAKDY